MRQSKDIRPPASHDTAERTELFVLLFAEHRDRLFGYILTLVGRRADAEDLFQETSLVLWRHFVNYNPERDFMPWARTIAFNQVRNYRRKQYRDRQIIELYYGTDHTAEQLAGHFGRSVYAVRKVIRRIRRALLECVDKGMDEKAQDQ